MVQAVARYGGANLPETDRAAIFATNGAGDRRSHSPRGANRLRVESAFHGAAEEAMLLAKKLHGYDALSDVEMHVLFRQTVKGGRTFDAGTDIVRQGDRPAHSCLLVQGWAARSKTLEDGGRQITAFHVPGDFVDLHSFLLHEMDHSVMAVTACRVAFVPHENLRRISSEHPHLTRLFWLNTLVDAAIHRNWIVALGRLPAVNRMAQLVCEMYVRLEVVELARNLEFEFPLTQPAMADALGMSLVQVSRSLKALRREGLLGWRARTVQIPDWERLAAFASFDPAYLSLRREPR
jgi:CRP-like cAMP-binding protein